VVNMKKFSVYIFLICIMVAAVFAAQSGGDLSGSSAVSISLVNQDPDPAIAGDIVEVRVGVENIGGEALDNLIVELLPEYPFELISGVSAAQNIGTISGYQSGENMKIVKYKVRVNKDVTAGSYELKIKYYPQGSQSSTQKSISIDVQNQESAEVIYIDRTTLVPGKEDSLKFTINNVGSAPLRDLTFSWVNEDKIILPVGGDNTKYVKYIDIGDSVELDYNVIADSNALAGLYELKLQLTYSDPTTNGEKEIDTIAGLYVGGGTDFDVAFSESSSGQISFTIANIGSNPAVSVSVIVPQQQGWTVSGSNSMIIGNLNKGDYTVASFGLQSTQARSFNTNSTQQRGANQQESSTQQQGASTQRSTQSQNTLKVQIAYTDTMGKRETVEKEVNVNLQASTSASTSTQATGSQTTTAYFGGRQQKSFFSKYKWYITVLAVLIVIGAAYWKYRKEKSLNPNFKARDMFSIRVLFKKKSKAR
jgi:hypothetical protein